jgi:hypothetical protein
MSDPLEVADARDLLAQLLDGMLDAAFALHCIREHAVIETRSNRCAVSLTFRTRARDHKRPIAVFCPQRRPSAITSSSRQLTYPLEYNPLI